MRILREHYLRDDIEHGIGNELDKLPSNNKPNKFCKTNYWILPDTNIFLNNIDAIEQTQFSNMIILQTVQNELKRRSAPNYKRLKTLISSGRKSFVFVNEFAKGMTHLKLVIFPIRAECSAQKSIETIIFSNICK